MDNCSEVFHLSSLEHSLWGWLINPDKRHPGLSGAVNEVKQSEAKKGENMMKGLGVFLSAENLL